jgi:vancomycin resistance protein YoaR
MLTCCAVILGVPLLLTLLLQAGVDLFGTVRVGGVEVTRDSAGLASLQSRAEQWEQGQVTAHVGPYLARATRQHFGARLPLVQLQDELLSLGRTGNPLTDLMNLWASRRGGLDLPWQPELSRTVLEERLREMRDRLERPPVPGALLPNGTELPGTPGLSINVVAATDRLARALIRGESEVTLDVLRIAPKQAVPYRRDMVAQGQGQFGYVLSEFVTQFRTGRAQAGRIHNIELAVKAIEGVVLEPGGELSFNESVGKRSYERGFETANEISNRRIVRGVGGGVCQVAATLHAAAFLAGFALPVYRQHSRPAKYIELGLDTMVAWPQQDMRIANVYPFPVRVRASALDGKLTVRLEGAGKAHPVEWSTQVLSRVKPGVQRVEDPELLPGQTQLLQEAIDGVTVLRKRTIYLPTGPSVEEKVLRYPPNDRIVAVSGEGDGVEYSSSSLRALREIGMEDF